MLPKIPYRMPKSRREVVAMGGINYSAVLRDGDIADSAGISARQYPYLTTAKAQRRLEEYSGSEAMTVFGGKIVTVRGGKLYHGDRLVGDLLPGKKQFAAINTKLVIMPDKVYLDGVTGELCPMGAETFSANTVFTTDTMTVNDSLYRLTHGYGGKIEGGVLTVSARETIIPRGTLTKISTFSETVSNGTFQYKRFSFYEHLFSDRDVEVGIYRTFDGRVNGEARYKYYYYITISALTAEERESIAIGDVLVVRDLTGTPWSGTVEDKDDRYIYLAASQGYLEALGEGVREKYRAVSIYRGLSPDIGNNSRYCIASEEGERVCGFYKDGNSLVVSMANNGPLTYIVPDGLREDVTLSTLGYDDLTAHVSVGDELSLVTTWDDTVTAVVVAVTATTVTFADSALACEYLEHYKVTLFKSVDVDLSPFKAGDTVFISGSANNDKAVSIISAEGGVITVGADTFTEETVSGIVTIERRIPELDFICESDNRIWGCSNTDNTIYASALGDPTNFFDYTGCSADSYAVAVGSEEEFTACAAFGDAVLFFKELKLHKVLGSSPSEYALYSYDIEGVQRGCDKSLQIINEVLYYKGIHGVFAFSGSPRLISENFGEKVFSEAVAGSDGDTFHISMSDGERDYLFAYETAKGIWVLEGDERVTDFARIGGSLYMLEGGEVYLCGAEETETGAEWFVQFTPLYETIEGKKSYSRLLIRLEMPVKSYVVVSVRCDGGAWREAGKIVGGKQDTLDVRLPINRCDKFEVKLRGNGKCTIKSILREFHVGGER